MNEFPKKLDFFNKKKVVLLKVNDRERSHAMYEEDLYKSGSQ